MGKYEACFHLHINILVIMMPYSVDKSWIQLMYFLSIGFESLYIKFSSERIFKVAKYLYFTFSF